MFVHMFREHSVWYRSANSGIQLEQVATLSPLRLSSPVLLQFYSLSYSTHSRYYSQFTYSIVYPIIYAQFNHYDTVSFSLLHSGSLPTSIRSVVYSRTHGKKVGNTRLMAYTRLFCMRIKRNLFKNSIAFFFKKKCTPSDAQSAVAGLWLLSSSSSQLLAEVAWLFSVVLLLLLLLAVLVLVVGFFFGLCFVFVVCWFSLRASPTYTGIKWVKITNQIEWKSNTLNKLHRFEVLFQHFNLGRKLRYKIHLTQKTSEKKEQQQTNTHTRRQKKIYFVEITTRAHTT